MKKLVSEQNLLLELNKLEKNPFCSYLKLGSVSYNFFGVNLLTLFWKLDLCFNVHIFVLEKVITFKKSEQIYTKEVLWDWVQGPMLWNFLPR
jgi:hypothetical protein